MASKVSDPPPAAQATTTSTNDEVDLINKRLSKILETRLDTDREALEALTDLSTFFTDNTLQTRRNLRSQIERRSLAINEQFLAAFREVRDSFDTVCTDITAMTASISGMQERLRATQSQTAELIQQTNALQATGAQLQLHQEVAGAFLTRFQLTVDEHQQLYGTSTSVTTGGSATSSTTTGQQTAPINAAFFDVLARVHAIHAECRLLLQSGYQTAALDIMEEMTLHQEAALERLYRWTQAHCRNVVAAAADAGDGCGSLVCTAMNRLQDRPVLFKYVLDEYATARRAVLVRSFIDALTVGPKPIELHAHDPKRYIGDMFAWIHQAVPAEKENLLALLRDCDRGDCSGQVQTALAHISDGLCPPLKVRVETVLRAGGSGGGDVIVLYAVSNLMRFYQQIVGAVVRGGQLDDCLAALQAFSEQAYLQALAAQVREQLQSGGAHRSGQPGGLEPPQRDLVPPAGVARLLSTLKEILSVASMVESREHDITQIVACVLDPLLQAVTESASHLPTVDMAVYLLNCVYQMQSTLAVYEYVDARLERLQGQADAQLDTLTAEQASSLVANLSLGPIYTLLQQRGAAIDLAHMRAFHGKFERFLDVPEMLLLPQVGLLQSGTHRAAVQRRAFSVIVVIYGQLWEREKREAEAEGGAESVVGGGADGGDDTLFRRTPAEVEELLSG